MAKKKKQRELTYSKAAEREFLAQYDTSKFPHPSVAVDVALLTAREGELRVVLTQRDQYPDLGRWSLPGGFVNMDESLEEAANRHMEHKAGVRGVFLEQLYTFGHPDRDPRTRVVAIAYYALVHADKLLECTRNQNVILAPLHVQEKQAKPARAKKEGSEGSPKKRKKKKAAGQLRVAATDSEGRKLRLAFDHAEMLKVAVERLRGKLDYAPIGFELLPREFTLRELQTIHETILGHAVNKDSFRRRMLATGLIAATGKHEPAVGHRPAELYRFRRRG